MGENLEKNPFAGLFDDKDSSSSSEESSEDKVSEEKLLQNVFGILRQGSEPLKKQQLVAIDCETTNSTSCAIYERITTKDIQSKLVPPEAQGIPCHPLTIETRAIPYLFGCFCELEKSKNDLHLHNATENLRKIVINHVALVLEEGSCVPEQSIRDQYIELFKDNSILPQVTAFTREVATSIFEDNDDNPEQMLLELYRPIIDFIHVEIKKSELLIFQQYWFNFLQIFASIEPLAEIIILYNTPGVHAESLYPQSLLGAPLGKSCLPKMVGESYAFFDPPLEKVGTDQPNIWSALEYMTESMYKVFHSLLKCSVKIRDKTLTWLGNCIETNLRRGELYHENNVPFITDGFMLNLGHVLLRLCQPFCPKVHEKVPKIDPTYCASQVPVNRSFDLNNDENLTGFIHLEGLNKETCLIPTPSGESRPTAESFNFVTECFMMTHKALHLGYNIVVDKFFKANRDMQIAQRTFNEAHSTILDQDLQRGISQQVHAAMTKFLSLKASLTTPDMIDHLVRFHATTAFWLMQVMIDDSDQLGYTAKNYWPKQLKTITFPLPENAPQTWKCIPEFIVENLIRFLRFIRRVNPNLFEEHGLSFMNPILTEIIVLMGSSKRLFNPHLRAELAEALEALIPLNDDTNLATLGSFYREQLFLIHPHRHHIVSNLLKVFVSIEMTGHSVQFEQKFNYRRPMYAVMKYLWTIEEHRNVFKELAQDAEKNIEAVQPPVFLRFINLLINDAVFLIDEALSNMAQLKNLQRERNTGEWDRLPILERGERHNLLQQIENIARFDNILGRDTISTLKMLTTEIKSIFSHPIMVDRIASMLNYILLQLVGPNNRNFKVKSQQEYEFNPSQLVIDICEMYLNLGDNETFILAVSQDGRSYNSELFNMTQSVLVRINAMSILERIPEFAVKVHKAASVQKEEDEILLDAPDDFLDPIMSTIMMNPVILPSSKVTVDRQTIARHLLSDQTDPFNRSHLTMDMVESNEELREKIHAWVANKKQSKPSSSHQ